MTEEAPAAPTMPSCNGSVPPEDEDGPRQVIGGIDEIAKSVGTVPYANAETGPDAPPEKENLEENRNSLAEDITPEDFAGEKRCQGTVHGCLSVSVGRKSSDPSHPPPPCPTGPGDTEGQSGGAGQPGTAGSPSGQVTESPAARADPRGSATEEEEDDAEEEDTEEDEVQVIEIKKENSEVSCLQQRDKAKEPSPPASPGCNSPLERPGEQPSLGKKNDISRHSYSRYNTISYRRIRKGNTKQRIDEFESMMHL
ncbi:ERMIN protein, partial [Smithornis capensis]|nr:ERMIN protein [Smithornis capensis]